MTSQIENPDAAATPNDRPGGLSYFLEQQAANPAFFEKILEGIDVDSEWAHLTPEERDAISAMERHFHPDDLAKRSKSTREVMAVLHLIKQSQLIDTLNQALDGPSSVESHDPAL